ncbi:MAG: hypothetical protein V4510_11315 [bacterium]
MKLAFLAAVVAVALVAAPATAHKTIHSNNGKVTLIYGNLYEPVSTYQKTGLDLGIQDAKGNPLVGLESTTPALNVTLTYGSTPDAGVITMTGKLTAQADRPGWYTYPIIYTKPGLYYLHVRGLINGTNVNIDITPDAAVAQATDNMFPPAPDSTPESQNAKISQLEKDVAALKAQATEPKAAGGLSGFAIDATLLALAAVVATRRRA